jgi:ribonucleotide reductase alpha subunit
VSKEAERIDVGIAETIYHAALTESCARARTLGKYPKFDGSLASEGRLQQDLWLEEARRNKSELSLPPPIHDWAALREDIKQYGLRNSLLVAYMPTVTTSQIMGNNESFEPYHSNIYTKTTLAGKFTVCNTSMIRHLCELGLWNDEIKNAIIENNGSLRTIVQIPQHIRDIYKTVWEISQMDLMKRAALRSAYIDQGSSLNIHIEDNSNAVLRAVFFAGYDNMLKTGSYYIRTKPAASAIKTNIAEMKTGKKHEQNHAPAENIKSESPASPQPREEEVVEVCRSGFCTA